jgi:hypothetical protein
MKTRDEDGRTLRKSTVTLVALSTLWVGTVVSRRVHRNDENVDHESSRWTIDQSISGTISRSFSNHTSIMTNLNLQDICDFVVDLTKRAGTRS